MTFEGKEVVQLEGGDLFHFEANRIHELEALEDFKAIVKRHFHSRPSKWYKDDRRFIYFEKL